MKRLVALAVMLVTSSASAAKPYVSLDLAGERTTGTYHWARPAIGISEFSTTVTGYGVSLGGAVGVTLASSFSLAAEGAGAVDDASGDSFGGIRRGRVGARFELRDEPPFFARAAFGLEWLRIGRGSGDTYGWEPEGMRGLYGTLTIGVRDAHLGPFLRADIAHDISEHATFTPVTLAVGADLTF